MADNLQEELLTRGISSIYPSKEFLASKLNSGEKLTIYLGIDPTGPTLHLGHAIPLLKLAQFQKQGHKIILLMGDFTATIGDPTDKSATRKQLTRKEVLSNLKTYKKQASHLISFTGKNPAEFKFNSKWLGKLSFTEGLSIASNMTVSQMLERDMFQKRMEEGKPIFIHEFLYPLMQGYDSVAMNVDGEIGGNDQTFNMLCGRDLMKTLKNKEKFVVAVKLLEDSNGKKMGKTEGNIVALSDSSEEMYGKIMSWSDGLIIPAFELCTYVPMLELENIAKEMAEGRNPKDLKMKLAKKIVSIFHGEKKALLAEEGFNKTFQKGGIPDVIKEVENQGKLIKTIFISGAAASISEASRLADAGAVTDMTEDKKATSKDDSKPGHVYKIGKHKFIKVK
ncbi:MAG: tyrosine--tRNA ligase [Patescibacteria group bacterium]